MRTDFSAESSEHGCQGDVKYLFLLYPISVWCAGQTCLVFLCFSFLSENSSPAQVKANKPASCSIWLIFSFALSNFLTSLYVFYSRAVDLDSFVDDQDDE